MLFEQVFYVASRHLRACYPGRDVAELADGAPLYKVVVSRFGARFAARRVPFPTRKAFVTFELR
jgi:hypothetical protein